MVQVVKAGKPEGLSCPPGIQCFKDKNQLPGVVLWCQHACLAYIIMYTKQANAIKALKRNPSWQIMITYAFSNKGNPKQNE